MNVRPIWAVIREALLEVVSSCKAQRENESSVVEGSRTGKPRMLVCLRGSDFLTDVY